MALTVDPPDLDIELSALVEALTRANKPVMITDGVGALLYANPPFEKITGHVAASVLGSRLDGLIASSTAHPNLGLIAALGESWVGELSLTGSVKVKATISPLAGRRLMITCLETVSTRSYEPFFKTMWRSTQDALLIGDFDTAMLLEINGEAQRLLGYTPDQIRSLKGRDLHPPESAEVIEVLSEDLRSKKRAWRPRIQMRRGDGRVFWASMSSTVFESGGRGLVLSILRDVTEVVDREVELAESLRQLKRTQAMLVQSEKLAAVGQLAAGVAHEINNPAAYIMLNQSLVQEHLEAVSEGVEAAQGLLDELGDAELLSKWAALRKRVQFGQRLSEAREAVVDNIQGTERIRAIVRELRQFSRSDDDREEALSVTDTINAACNLVQNEIRHRARLVRRLEKLPPVLATPNKLLQVLINLLVNAAQSIETGNADQNEIRISTSQSEGMALISISDSGCGIPAVQLSRIFEPFFSTKAKDEGTGLGLAISAEIIRQHKGELHVESTPGEGSTFTIKLPLGHAAQAHTPPPMSSEFVARRRLKMLVIDDEPSLLRAYKMALEPHHRVVCVGSGAAGLDVLDEDSSFDLVLCDLMMPRVDGPRFYHLLKARSPELLPRVIFCSGGTFTPSVSAFISNNNVPLLDKPLNAKALLAALESHAATISPQAG